AAFSAAWRLPPAATFSVAPSAPGASSTPAQTHNPRVNLVTFDTNGSLLKAELCPTVGKAEARTRECLAENDSTTEPFSRIYASLFGSAPYWWTALMAHFSFDSGTSCKRLSPFCGRFEPIAQVCDRDHKRGLKKRAVTSSITAPRSATRL